MDERVAVRTEVERFVPRTPREQRSRATFLSELERLPHPLDQLADPVHVTGSAIVVGPRGTILHLHKRLQRWMQPGGHLERGEAAWEAALRETAEETGLAVRHPSGGPRMVHLDVHPAAGDHVHLDLRYLLEAPDEYPVPGPGESQEVRWFSWDEAIAAADEALVDALVRLRPSD
jgi:8-oxo-dGTP pyrophosphatase MutT (NUDIX family)